MAGGAAAVMAGRGRGGKECGEEGMTFEKGTENRIEEGKRWCVKRQRKGGEV